MRRAELGQKLQPVDLSDHIPTLRIEIKDRGNRPAGSNGKQHNGTVRGRGKLVDHRTAALEFAPGGRKAASGFIDLPERVLLGEGNHKSLQSFLRQPLAETLGRRAPNRFSANLENNRLQPKRRRFTHQYLENFCRVCGRHQIPNARQNLVQPGTRGGTRFACGGNRFSQAGGLLTQPPQMLRSRARELFNLLAQALGLLADRLQLFLQGSPGVFQIFGKRFFRQVGQYISFKQARSK